MNCAICGGAMRGEFCTNCGARAGQRPMPAAGGSYPPPVAYGVPTVDIGTRIGAFLIDVVPMLILGVVVGWIPILGFVIMGIVGAAYWLLRDFNGASIGKMVLGLVVVKKDGSPSDIKDRILRNVDLAFGPALMIIPLIGMFLSPITGIIGLIEVILLLVKHERLGDMLANTTVVKKPV